MNCDASIMIANGNCYFERYNRYGVRLVRQKEKKSVKYNIALHVESHCLLILKRN